MSNYSFQLFEFKRDIRQILRLFKICFNDKKLSESYLRWIYEDNPDGKVIAYNATTNHGDVIGHYAVIPRNYFGNQRVVLSLNTATHPEYQRKGIFGALAKLTYQRAVELGFQTVYGVANKNSIYTFENKLGFKVHGQIKLGIRTPYHFRGDNINEYMNFEQIAWRLQNPAKKYYMVDLKDSAEIYTRLYNAPVYLGSIKYVKTSSFYKFGAQRYLPYLVAVSCFGEHLEKSNQYWLSDTFIRKKWYLISKDLCTKEPYPLDYPSNFGLLMDTF